MNQKITSGQSIESNLNDRVNEKNAAIAALEKASIAKDEAIK